jgi:hypothetical protein
MKTAPTPWLTRLLDRQLACRDPIELRRWGAGVECGHGEDRLAAWAERSLWQSGFAMGLPRLPADLIGQLSDQREDALVVLVALVRWSADLLDELVTLHRGLPWTDDQLRLALVQLWAVRLGCADQEAAVTEAFHRRGLDHGIGVLELPLLPGLLFAEAQAFAELAIAAANPPVPASVRDGVRNRTLRFRRALTSALLGLAHADLPANGTVRKVWHGQLMALPLSRTEKAALKRQIERPLPAAEAAALYPFEDDRRQLLEQTVIGAALDGHSSRDELDYLARFAAALGYDAESYDALSERCALFLIDQWPLIERLWDDVPSAGNMGDNIAAALKSHSGKISTEFRETAETLAVLGGRAMGKSPSREQWRQVRSTLADLGRSAPALALFAMPGGALLLPLALKTLPFDLRPTAYRDSHRAPDWFDAVASTPDLFAVPFPELL